MSSTSEESEMQNDSGEDVDIESVVSDRDLEAATDELTFYFGCASGASKAALRRLEEPNIMISFATKNHYSWDGIESLFIDSGGFSILVSDKYDDHPSVNTYRSYLRGQDPEYYTLQDYPCEPDLLDEHDRTVDDHIQMTVDKHVECLDRIPESIGTPVPVIQGWEIEDYLDCIDRFREQGILPHPYVSVGSVKRKYDPVASRDIVKAVRKELGSDTNIHALGVKTQVFSQTDAALYIDSADSNAYDRAASRRHGTGRWEASAIEYLKMKLSIEELTNDHETQQQLSDFT